MTWTHEERQVLPSRLAEEALSQGMPAPHHPNCGNALSEIHTGIDGDGLSLQSTTFGTTPPLAPCLLHQRLIPVNLPYHAAHEGAARTTASNVLPCIQVSEQPCS
jgi:hypothetical protein